ncbi:3-dehydroquinate synthase [Terasakiella sp. SH-1]|uniref:3-dehydroquinate synthase n=1 Tax=Terasakiella sp. SH-1 TaxID=2560057 RepID=UPI001074174E|nr:3-dehydroquinate synthase [Terasakiella sp. SH-1]
MDLAKRINFKFLSILSVIMAMVIIPFMFYGQAIEGWFEEILTETTETVIWALIAYCSLALDIVLPIPSSIVGVATGLSVGPLYGFLIIWAGLCTGCVLGYGIGNGASHMGLVRFINPKDWTQAHQITTRLGIGSLIIMRAVPVLAETSVMAAGIMRMDFKIFLLTTILANAGIAMIYASAGFLPEQGTSFFAAFAGAIALPGLCWLVARPFQKKLFEPLALNVLDRRNTQTYQFHVPFSFPFITSEAVFAPQNLTFVNILSENKTRRNSKFLLVVDEGVASSWPDLEERVNTYIEAHAPFLSLYGRPVIIPGGEQCKNTEGQIATLHRHMLDGAIDRHSYVVVIGGGAVLDCVGFAAATFHRGVRLVRLPTTVLAQCDAGIGVKNGVNAFGLKNLIGSFAAPYAIINDPVFLNTLENRDLRSGIAEAIKVALIRDKEFYDWIDNNSLALSRFEPAPLNDLIKRCAELHLDHITEGGDPFETGSNRPLDFGHWSAHKLEAMSSHDLRHGEAVAIGIALDVLYAMHSGLLSSHSVEHIIGLLENIGFELSHPVLHTHQKDLLAGIEEFREHIGGELCITTLTGIGKSIEIHEIDYPRMESALRQLLARA